MRFSQDGTHVIDPVVTGRIADQQKMMTGERTNIGTATLSHTNGSNLLASATVFDSDMSASGKAVQLPYNASDALVDVSVNITFTPERGSLGLWIYKPPIATGSTSSTDSSLAFYFTRDGFSNFAFTALLIHPGLNFYTIPLVLFGNTSPPCLGIVGSNPLLTGAITTIRIRNSNAAVVGVTYTGLVANETIEIGDLFQITPPKAKFIFGFDDCKLDLLHPRAGAIAGFDGISKKHSYLSFLETYGWRAICYAIAGAVGGRPLNGESYLTVNELKHCRDKYGAIIANHSNHHPNSGDVAGAATNMGMALLGPYGYALTSGATFTSGVTGATLQPTNDYTAIYNDLIAASEQLNKWGFTSALEHLALPQGTVDKYVNQALQKMGFKTVRGVDGGFGIVSSESTGNETGLELRSSAINLKSSIQTDQGSATQASFILYVDKLIAAGGIGSNYCHTFGTAQSTSMTQTKYLADYLKEKETAGLIDIITVEDLF